MRKCVCEYSLLNIDVIRVMKIDVYAICDVFLHCDVFIVSIFMQQNHKEARLEVFHICRTMA